MKRASQRLNSVLAHGANQPGKQLNRWTLGVVILTILSCISSSCQQQKSLQELLQEERKAIDKFISTNNLVILKEYPKDGVFKEKEYFRTNEGLFFHVVDSGNGTKVQLLNDVTVRFDYYQPVKNAVKGDSTHYYPNSPYEPYSFVYGLGATYSAYYTPVCQAWVIPLSYVGEGAILDLVIPSSIGSYMDNTNITPIFYKNLHYTRFN